MSEELRPCPFCGSMPVIEKTGDVVCANTDCIVLASAIAYGVGDTPVAFAAWNTRPVEDALRARISELEAALGAMTQAVNDATTRIAEMNAALVAAEAAAESLLPIPFSAATPFHGQDVWAFNGDDWEPFTYYADTETPEHLTHWLPMPPAPGGDA